MKKIALIFLSIFHIYLGFAQKDFITKWGNGTPKNHFILRGVDTLFFETFYENGSIRERRWHNDSIFKYDRRGIAFQKQFFNTGAKYKTSPIIDGEKPDSLIEFLPNGIIMSRKYTDNEGLFHKYIYTIEGKLEYCETKEKINDTLSKILKYNQHNKLFEITWHYHNSNIGKDTSYYESGKIRYISETHEGRILSFFKFDENGQVKFTKENYFSILNCLRAVIHDSIEEKKDIIGGSTILTNEDFPDSFLIKKQGGLQGLVDMRGNWILQPEFDDIITYRGDQFKVKFKGKFGVATKNKRWLIPPQYDDLEFTHLNDIFIVKKNYYREYASEKNRIETTIDNDNDEFPDFSGGATEKKNEKRDITTEEKQIKTNDIKSADTSNTSKIVNYYKDEYGRYGLININGIEILPIKYQRIEPMNWRSSVFLVETGTENPQNREDVSKDGQIGLFDGYSGFVVDTCHLWYTDDTYSNSRYDILKYNENSLVSLRNRKTGKIEVFNHFGQSILNSTFDGIQTVTSRMAARMVVCGLSYDYFPNHNFYPDFGYIITHSKGKSGIYDLDKQKWLLKPNQYDTIVGCLFNHDALRYPYLGLISNNDVDADLVLLAKKRGKWHILNKEGQPIWRDDFETMGEISDDCPFSFENPCPGKSIFGVKNDRIVIFSQASYPKHSTVKEDVYFEKGEETKTLYTYEGKKITINQNGSILR